jgi:hypothetical protein
MKKTSLLGSIALAAMISAAQADIIPVFASAVAEGSDFRWNYSTNVTFDQEVRTGDFFTIYDFGELTPGSNLQPAGWVFSSALIGITPSTVLPNDDPNIFNLTWTYTAATTISGQAFLGIFSALSGTNQLRTDNFAARATQSTGPFAGTKIDNIGTIAVPVPEMSALAPIIGVCGLAVLGFFSSMLRRRRA